MRDSPVLSAVEPRRRLLCAGTGALLSAMAASAQARPVTAAAAPAAPRADVAGLDAAIAAKDVSALDRLIHPELLWIRGSGAVAGKTEFLAAMGDPALRIEPFRPIRTRLYAADDLELWTGMNTLRGRLAGEAFVDRHHFADLWRREDGRWRLAYIQVTPASDSGAVDADSAT